MAAGSTVIAPFPSTTLFRSPDGSSFDNTASVSSTTTDPNGANNSSTDTAHVIAQTDLSITKTGPSTAIPVDSAALDYTLTITNNGPSDNAGGFTVSATLPAG